MDPVTDAGAAALLGLKPLTILGSAVGGFISLTVFDGQTTTVRWTAAVGGASLAMLVAEPLTVWAGVPPKVETLIAIFVAIFGMSIVTATARALREIKFVDVFWAVLGKFGINKPAPPPGGPGSAP